MTDRPDRLRLGRVAQHASVRRERTQSTDDAGPSTSHAQDAPPSASSSRRRRDSVDDAARSPSSRRPRLETPAPAPADDVDPVPPPERAVPPLEGDVPPPEGDDTDAEPEGFPGGPSDTSLLTQYADHAARHVWDGEVTLV